MTPAPDFGWFSIVRLGLVQAMLGAIVVLTTSTLNRVMVVELALPALLPGLLVALHYAVQTSRPRMGFGSDIGGRRTPWIVGGMVVLALGGLGGAALSDLARWLIGSQALGYASVFLLEAGLFVAAAWLAALIAIQPALARPVPGPAPGTTPPLPGAHLGGHS
jgi:BCD family chlorophyll transporter-like MFS transporter